MSDKRSSTIEKKSEADLPLISNFFALSCHLFAIRASETISLTAFAGRFFDSWVEITSSALCGSSRLVFFERKWRKFTQSSNASAWRILSAVNNEEGGIG